MEAFEVKWHEESQTWEAKWREKNEVKVIEQGQQDREEHFKAYDVAVPQFYEIAIATVDRKYYVMDGQDATVIVVGDYAINVISKLLPEGECL